MQVRINPESIQSEEIHKVVKALKNGALIIYPTDSVYAVACDMMSHEGVEKLCRFKKIDPKKSRFTLMCSDISQISEYTTALSNSQFKLLRKAFPGPYTIILEAGNRLPKILKQNKKTIGVRVPANPISLQIVQTLGNPLLTSSLHDSEDEILDYYTDPDVIFENHKGKAELIINGGYGNIVPSTIIDYTGTYPEILREGSGDINVVF